MKTFTKHLTKQLIVAFSLLPSLLFAQAYTLQDDDVEVDANGYIISCSYDFSNKEIIIPSTLDGVTVKGIEQEVFIYKGLTKVELPSTLVMLGYGCFAINALTTVTIPNGVKNIYGWAFQENQLNSIIIPASVDSIGEAAFETNLIQQVTIPETIKYIGQAAFNDNIITTVNGASSNGLFYERTGSGSEDKTSIISYGGSLKNVDFIPEEVVNIGTSAFSNCSITSITLPQNLLNIGAYAFAFNKLVSLEIPLGIKKIRDNSFSDNILETVVFNGQIDTIEQYAFKDNSLTEVELTNAISFIGTYAFSNNKLSEINLPANLTIIEPSAFYNNKITSVNFATNSILKTIGAYAFSNNLLTSVSIPSLVTTIGEEAFLYNTGLNSLSLPNPTDAAYSKWIDGNGKEYNLGSAVTNFEVRYYVDFEHALTCSDVEIDDNGIIQKYYTNGATSIIIPETLCGKTVRGIKDIEDWDDVRVFSYKGLTSITLPNTMEAIGRSSFYGNYLKEVILPENLIFMGSEAFHENPVEQIQLPTPTKDGYIFQYWEEEYDKKSFEGGEYLKKSNNDYENKYVAIFKKDPSTSINKNIQEQNILVYPNPASTTIHIQLETSDNGSAKLYDMSGKLFISQAVSFTNPKVNIAMLPSGLYILEVVSGKYKKTVKIKKK